MLHSRWIFDTALDRLQSKTAGIGPVHGGMSICSFESTIAFSDSENFDSYVRSSELKKCGNDKEDLTCVALNIFDNAEKMIERVMPIQDKNFQTLGVIFPAKTGLTREETEPRETYCYNEAKASIVLKTTKKGVHEADISLKIDEKINKSLYSSKSTLAEAKASSYEPKHNLVNFTGRSDDFSAEVTFKFGFPCSVDKYDLMHRSKVHITYGRC